MQEKINPNIHDLFETAKKFSKNKNFDLAIEYFNKCIKYKTLKNDVLFEKIKIFYELKDYVEIIKYAKHILSLKSNKKLQNILKIFLAKSYKALGEINKATIVLDSVDIKYIREHFVEFSKERIDCSYFKFNHFRSQEFSGDLKKLQKEFESLKKLQPQNKVQLFYLSRVSNLFHNYNFTKKLISTYAKNFNYKDIFYDNAILNEFEIANRDVILKSKPRSMWIATNSKCNIKCEMCGANNINWSLSKNNIQDIYEYMPYLEWITWWGGEPTISKTFYEMLNFSLRYKNIKHTIITNGQYMPKKLIDIIAGNNNIEVVFSIDSINKERYEKIRKGASFDKLVENLSKLSKSVKYNVIKVNIVVMKDTINEFDKIIDFAKKCNIKQITLIPLSGDKMSDNKLTDDDIKLVNEFSKNTKELEIFNAVNMSKKDNKKYRVKGFCHIPWGDITISYMGFLCNDNNCSFFGAKNYKLTESNMGKYWNSDVSKNMRKYILKNRYCSRYCPKVSRNIL